MFKIHKYIIPVAVSGLLLMGQGCAIIPGQDGFLGKTKVPNNNGGVFRSDDHGLSWKQVVKVTGQQTAFSLKDATIRTMLFDPRDPDHMYIGTRENGVWVTKNSGVDWQVTGQKTGDVSCIVYYPTDPDVMYLAVGISVRKSIDAGKTWTTVYDDGQGQAVNCVAINRNVPEKIWATTSGGKILSSIDAGKTWTIALNIPAMTPRKIVFDATGNNKMTIFTKSKGIIEVDTNNLNWQNISAALTKYPGSTTINGVAVVEGATTAWIMATKYGLIESFDYGQTWSVIPTLVNPGSVGIQNVSLNPRDPQEMFITIGQKLHHTMDAGKTWTVVSIPTTRLPVELRFDPVRVDRLYVGTFRNIN